MSEEKTPQKRRTRFLAPVSSLALLLIFFVAPIVPIDVAYPCHPGDVNLLHYTDWESPSYHLFNIGYHYATPHIICY